MNHTFEQFIRERQYLQNVTPATVEWYKQSFRWLDTESPSESNLKALVMRMREKGLKATGCNCSLRAINAFLKWAGSPHRVPKLKETQLVLPTFTLPQVTHITSYRPKGFYPRRLHLIVLMLLDTGCRIDEVLSLHVADCDLDNLLLTVTGKGRKRRRIPFSRRSPAPIRSSSAAATPHQLEQKSPLVTSFCEPTRWFHCVSTIRLLPSSKLY